MITGWVRNLADGRVESVIEGPAESLEDFVNELIESTHGRVADIKKSIQSATGQFTNFEIRPSG